MQHRALLKTEGTVFPKKERPRLAKNVALFIFYLRYFFESSFCVQFQVKLLRSNRTYARVRDNSGTKSDKKKLENFLKC